MWQEDADVWSDARVRTAGRSVMQEAVAKRAAVVVQPRVDADCRRQGIPARLARRFYGLRFHLVHARRHTTVDLASVHGLRLLILPGVFHPQFFFATAFFLRCLDHVPVAQNAQVLDMGTGSGALAVALARRGASVTAVDVNAEAVRCARANALLHGLQGRMEVLEGDLFKPVVGRRFDLMVFNPPFYERSARDMPDRAWAAGPDSEAIFRFCRKAPDHLKPGGILLIMGSTEAPYTGRLRHMQGYSVHELAHLELVSERLTLFSLRNTPQLRS